MEGFWIELSQFSFKHRSDESAGGLTLLLYIIQLHFQIRRQLNDDSHEF